MCVDGNWILFSYKPPYSAVAGRDVPYDFPVLYAYLDHQNKVCYGVDFALSITNRYYRESESNLLAWRGFEEFRV